MTNSFIVVDIETTGMSPTNNSITEIGAIKIINNKIVGEYSQLINPEAVITPEITAITGLTNDYLKDKPVLEEVFAEFLEFNEELPLIGHNILFDYSFLKYHGNQLGYEFERNGLDTLRLASYYVSDLKSKSLTSLISYFDINRKMAHRAYHDAKATYEVYKYFRNHYMKDGEEEMFKVYPMHWKPKKTSPITLRQKNYLKVLIDKHKIYKEIKVSELSKSEASRYIDKILFVKGK